MTFHDAGTFDGHSGEGADGSLQFELDRQENGDFVKSIEFYSKFLQRGVSMADSIAFGGMLAVQKCQNGRSIRWRYGRLDATGANRAGMLPDPRVSAKQIYEAFVERMDFSVRQTVALIIGAHSVARVNDKDLLPADGQPRFTDETPAMLDVGLLYDLLDDADYYGEDTASEEGLVRLPSDMNMANDPRMAREMRVLASRPGLFHAEFMRAFEKLISLGARFETDDYSDNYNHYGDKGSYPN